ncbi:MAG TPA: hypothetical protein VNO21_08500 [Polyangiaceae bacterium]|nr:hypothetical protein [Polyangiaceae bacterium]
MNSRIVGALGASVLALFVSFAAVAGCSSGAGDPCLDDATCADGTGNPPTTTTAICANFGAAYVGLGGADLTATRAEAVAGVDRGRSKPYSALVTEYARVLGADDNPTLLASSGATFDEPDARWYQEPQASAVSLYTAYRVAFDGCLQLTGVIANASGSAQGDAKYGVAPDAQSAKTECQAWARKFWSRAPIDDEVRACIDVAVVSSRQETINGTTTDTAPARRWAYACASVLSATGFLAY